MCQPMKLSASEAPTPSVLLPMNNGNEMASSPCVALAAISAVASMSAWSVRAGDRDVVGVDRAADDVRVDAAFEDHVDRERRGDAPSPTSSG